ncbi:M23 family metallopeptidase [Tenacibaculum jejuense]|uniref:Membrane metalloendopeptidase n=1 Tax=Tenacibaculum jejuense TaxID=584609 RepID=A0A238U6A7_9FLAO|nr:M23 family metallopeptidase [Tenacibaculum jejuense]SNR14014.1 Membrane metalloendopeptidase [Tenacibaculum jejuense]
MRKILLYFITLITISFSCSNSKKKKQQIVITKDTITLIKSYKDTIPKEFIAVHFDFPVSKPNAKGYYNAQKFQKNYHLGDDWNAVTGGNTDLGDPIYTIANGFVKESKDYAGGWGNVIRILHFLPNNKIVESLYAHCDTLLVKKHQWVKRGTKIGTIGTANGTYYAHLHFEIREDISLPLGPGYSQDTKGYLDPTEFIKNHRIIEDER